MLVAPAADRTAALGLDEGGAEIALQHLAEVAEVLDGDGVPEAHVAGRLLDHGVGRHGTQDDARRITRHRAQSAKIVNDTRSTISTPWARRRAKKVSAKPKGRSQALNSAVTASIGPFG